ncbi:hypothetical protein SBRCBS47491_008329 [Sporothrix bragantina]|uniref:Uncharacterized protein n=1 Tax=Sporothrix bragantina TaxID=671064 RepID=A0ABP0CLY9_9PEZI
MDDMLFEDDHSTSGYADVEVLDVRLDPSAKATPKSSRPEPLAARKSAHSMLSVSRSDSDFMTSPTSESSNKPLSKADSGYSSNVSLRSFKQAATKFMIKWLNLCSKYRRYFSAPWKASSISQLRQQHFKQQ